jgi:ribonuclease-3 family protein
VKEEITERMLTEIGRTEPLPDHEAKQESPLILAWIGDGIYEMVIRAMLVRTTGIPGAPVARMHRRASGLVNAETQSQMVGVWETQQLLTEDEAHVYHRGRNAKAATHAKNAPIQDYRRATGFEAVLGYLYLTGRMQRIYELVRDGLAGLKEKSEENDGR